MIRLIALDLDGTLAIKNHGVSTPTRRALEALHNDGVEVVIATGRRYRTTRFVIDNLGFEVFAVCNGGALVKTPEQGTLFSDDFTVTPIVELARTMNLTVFAQRDPHEHGGTDFIIDTGTPWNADTRMHFERNRDWCEEGNLLTSTEHYLGCGIMGTESELHALAAELEHRAPEFKAIIVPHTIGENYYCEIAPRHIDKWHGLAALRDHFGLHAENICAVGDQLNDMAMITAAGHGIAMANAHADLKAAADFICGHNAEDGLVDAVAYVREFNARQ